MRVRACAWVVLVVAILAITTVSCTPSASIGVSLAETDSQADTHVQSLQQAHVEMDTEADTDADADIDADSELDADADSELDLSQQVDTGLDMDLDSDLTAEKDEHHLDNYVAPHMAPNTLESYASDINQVFDATFGQSSFLENGQDVESELEPHAITSYDIIPDAQPRFQQMDKSKKKRPLGLSPYATLSRFSSHVEFSHYCASKKLILCPVTSICKQGVPAGGVRGGKVYVPISGVDAGWLAIGEHNTCKVRTHPKWGEHVFSAKKGYVSCCNPQTKKIVPASSLGKWEGFLLRNKKGKIYLVEMGKKRFIPDTKTFDALGFNPDHINDVPDDVLEDIDGGIAFSKLKGQPNSALYKHPLFGLDHDAGHPWDELEGFLIKRKKHSTVYMVERGYKRAIPSAETFEVMGFEWDRIKTVNGSLVKMIPDGVQYPLLRGKKGSKPYKHPFLAELHHGTTRTRRVNRYDLFRTIVERMLDRPAADADFKTYKFKKLFKKKKAEAAPLIYTIITSPEWLSEFHYKPLIKHLSLHFTGINPNATHNDVHLQHFLSAGVSAPIKERVAEWAASRERAVRYLEIKNIRKAVKNEYRQLLARDPTTPKTIDKWVKLVKKEGWAYMHKELLARPEYQQKFGDHSIPGKYKAYKSVIKSLYKQVLNKKKVGKKGMKYWLKCFNTSPANKCMLKFVKRVYPPGTRIRSFRTREGHMVKLKRKKQPSSKNKSSK